MMCYSEHNETNCASKQQKMFWLYLEQFLVYFMLTLRRFYWKTILQPIIYYSRLGLKQGESMHNSIKIKSEVRLFSKQLRQYSNTFFATISRKVNVNR